MNSRFYKLSNARSSGQLQSLSHYRDQELQQKQNPAAVADDGSLLEYEALELRIHPPNVRVDNDNPNHTVLIIDSANRPGTLVEVVQCLTELGLSVKQGRISSDGGWFVDEFHVSETPTGRVTDPKKLAAVKKVLSLPEHTGEPVEVHTVFQIAGPETPGLLADVTQLLSHNGLEIRTAAAWTFNNRAAIVIGVTEQNAAVHDHIKLKRLQQLLTHLIEKAGDNVAVTFEQVEGPVHHERRLHQLLLADEVQAWKQLSRLQRQHSLPFPGPMSAPVAAAAAAAAADSSTDVDSNTDVDQVPSTPRQQWQRKMLPPMWSVDQGGKPYMKGDLRQHLQQQQQHWLDQVQHAAVMQQQEGLEGPFAVAPEHPLSPDTQVQAAAAAPTTGPEQASTHQQQQQPTGRMNGFDDSQQGAAARCPATAMAIDSAAAHKAAADASAAAAAAQQASVDKLIALLQPQPLVHAISMPSGQQEQQEQQAGEPAVSAAAVQQQPLQPFSSAGSISQLHQVAAHQQQQQQQQQPQQSQTAPLPRLVGAVPPSMLSDGTMGGLPPRAPHMHTAPGILPPAQLVLQHTASGPANMGARLSSISAPTSPSVGPRGAPTAAGGGSGGTGQTPWSPRGLASASAAAGLLSPRAVPLAAAAAAAGGGGGGSSGGAGVMGLQQQQQQQQLLMRPQQSMPLSSPVATVLDAPEVQIQNSHLFNYWLVTIHCRDRNKLLFDTVCTLSDMRYDIYHATIDSEPCGMATQLFYIRPRFGECVWDERKAAVLKAMLVSAVQRRFPPGLRLHVFSGSQVCLQDLVSSFKGHKLTITRCKVRAFDASHTFYLLYQDGSLPSRQYVQMACQAAGGELVEAPLDVNNPCVSTVLRSLDARGRFAFSFVNQRSQQRALVSGQRQQPGVMALQQVMGPRGVMAPGGPIDINGGVLVAWTGDAGMHGGAGRRGVLALMRGDGSRELQPEQQKQQAGAAASYNSDQQPSF